VLVVFPIATSLVEWARSRKAADDDISAERIEKASHNLAGKVREQWLAESVARRLYDPYPVAVTWRLVRGSVADQAISPPVGTRRLVGHAGQAAELARWFRDLERQRLVIVGDPGMGKTTLAVLLLLELLRDEPKEQRPVPVMFSLASFDPGRGTLSAWLTRRLEQEHPWLGAGRAGTRLASALVSRRLVLPVLDGLDEVPERARPDVIEAINTAMSDGELGLVLTCRTAEYSDAVAARDVLRSAAVIEPDPITPRQAAVYLDSCIPPSQRTAWRPVLATLPRRPATPLAAALSTPLALWLVRHVYLDQGLDPARLTDGHDFPTADTIQQHLSDALIPALIWANPPDPAEPGRPRHSWDPDKAQRWLRFLARHLNNLGPPDLAWWQLWQALPSGTYGFAVGLAVAVAAGISAALPAGPTVGPVIAGLVVGLGAGLSGGLGVGLVLARWRGREPSAPTKVSHARDRMARALISASGAALVTATGAGLAIGLAFGLSSEITNGIAAGVRAGLAPALAAAVAAGATMALAGMRKRMPQPSRGLRLRPTLGGIMSALATGTGAGFAVGLPYGARYGATSALAVAASIGMAAMLEGAHTVDTVSPRTLLRQDWHTAIAVAIAAGLGVGVVFGLGFPPGTAIGVGASAGLGFAIVVTILRRPWLSYTLAHSWLALRGHLPWRLMSFLEDAHRLGALRQVGTVYQFRHIDLQHHFARRPPQPPSNNLNSRTRKDDPSGQNHP